MDSDRPVLGVVGGGSWGTALAHIAASGGVRVVIWARDPVTVEHINRRRSNPRYLKGLKLARGIEATHQLEQVADAARYILVAVPAKALREVVRKLGDHLLGDHLLVSAAKGLEAETNKRMTELFKEESCVKKVGVLSGPNLAREILDGAPTATVIASHFPEVIARGQKLLAGPRFRVYGNPDVIGVELGGALKNIIAIAAGAIDGMGFGANTKATLATRGLAEITRLGVRLGGKPATFSGLAGLGDLMVTCTSPLSRNYTVGYKIGKGKSFKQVMAEMTQVAEGVWTSQVVHKLARRLDVEVPITDAVYLVLHCGMNVNRALETLMMRQPRSEVERLPVG